MTRTYYPHPFAECRAVEAERDQLLDAAKDAVRRLEGGAPPWEIVVRLKGTIAFMEARADDNG